MRRLHALALLAALGTAVGVLYAQTPSFNFVRADDTRLIVENAGFLRDLSNLPDAFRRSYFEVAGEVTGERTYYRPIVIASFMIDAQFGGAAPFTYHLTNIIIHACAVWLLFALLVRLGACVEAALVAALLFAVHPLNVQAVAWVPGRNDPLMTVFGLIAFLGLIRFLAHGSAANTGSTEDAEDTENTETIKKTKKNKKTLGTSVSSVLSLFSVARWPALATHLGGFALALLTKESAVVLVLPFLLYSRLWLRAAPRRREQRLLAFAYAAIVAVWVVLRRAALGGGWFDLSLAQYATVVMSNLPDQLLYVAKAVIPVNLNTMPGVTPALAVQGVAALAFLGAVLAWVPDKRKAFLAAVWFVAPLAPGLLVVGLPAYEHRAYLPLVGLALLVMQAYPGLRVARPRLTRLGAGVICAILFTISFRHIGAFRDPFTYWASGASGTPHAPTAQINLGRLYEEQNDLERAAFHYQEALALDPYALMANNNLGVVMMRSGRTDEAEAYFRREVTLHPYNAQGHYNLGLYYDTIGKPIQAVTHWLRVVELDPVRVDAYRKLVDHYQARGDERRARIYRERIRALELGAR